MSADTWHSNSTGMWHSNSTALHSRSWEQLAAAGQQVAAAAPLWLPLPNRRFQTQPSYSLLCALHPTLRRARQHVPVDEYTSNLRAMVAHLRSVGVPAVILITPPPISEPDRLVHVEKVVGAWMARRLGGQVGKACFTLHDHRPAAVLYVHGIQRVMQSQSQ